MSSGIKVSVVVPAYNAESTVGDCIASLLKLHYPPEQRELIVVDNASTDRTGTILSGYRQQINVLFEKKRGAAAARNTGLRHARGEAIAFIDADCIADPDWLGKVIQPLHAPHVGVVGGRILAQGIPNHIEAFGDTIHDHNLSINKWKTPHPMTANWASPRAALQKDGFFDERFLRAQDCDLSYRLVEAGYKLVYEEQAIVYHKNKNTRSGLFVEGYRHGFHSVQLNKKHRAFLQNYGYRRFSHKSYKALWSSLMGTVLNSSELARYDFVFNLGKKAGRWCGSIRYRYLNF